MSSTSPIGGRRRFPTTALDAQQPLDPLYARDVLANNLLHLADRAHEKVLVNDVATKSTITTGNAGVTTTASAFAAVEWRTVQVYGPFDLSIFAYRGERIPYSVRVRLAATRTGDLEWACQLCLPDETTAILYDSTASAAPVDWMTFAAATGTAAWLDPDYPVITPSRGLIDRAVATQRTLDGIGGSDVVVGVTAVCIRVLGRSAAGTGTGALYGFHASEFLSL